MDIFIFLLFDIAMFRFYSFLFPFNIICYIIFNILHSFNICSKYRLYKLIN